ncbi:MAG: 6-pyruvoyl-tetrahydropterin synthase-related protein [Candidatus Gottesmanbacteria bacterium]
MKSLKNNKWLIVIILLSALPMFSMFTTSALPHTSDGAMHLARIASYYKEVMQGQFPVRWAGNLNYGFGTPIFNFFHPLPYMITTVFVALGSSLTGALKLSFLLSFLASGIGMYLLSRALWKDTQTAVLVTILYQFAPFRLVDILVRGSLGGIYAYTLLPFVLYGVVKLIESKRYHNIWIISFCSAGLAMSHNIVGFVFFGVAFIFTLFYPSPIRLKILSLLSLMAGIGIASFFVIPAILDHNYTYGYLLTKNLFYDHFAPFANFFLPNFTNTSSLRIHEVSVQIGIAHLIALITSVFIIIKKTIYGKKDTMIASFCVIIFLVTVFFMQPISKPLWENISILRQFQYPWRLLSVITFITALAGFSIVKIIKSQFIIICIVLFTIFSTVYYWVPPQGYQTINEQDYWDYPLTTNYYGEVDTIWSEGPAKGYPKEKIELIAGIATIKELKRTSTIHEYSVEASTPITLLDNTQYFPGWNVLVNNQKTNIQFQDPNHRGLITFDVPAGTSRVLVLWRENKTRLLADYISIFSIFIVLGLPYITRKKLLNI